MGSKLCISGNAIVKFWRKSINLEKILLRKGYLFIYTVRLREQMLLLTGSPGCPLGPTGPLDP